MTRGGVAKTLESGVTTGPSPATAPVTLDGTGDKQREKIARPVVTRAASKRKTPATAMMPANVAMAKLVGETVSGATAIARIPIETMIGIVTASAIATPATIAPTIAVIRDETTVMTAATIAPTDGKTVSSPRASWG